MGVIAGPVSKPQVITAPAKTSVVIPKTHPRSQMVSGAAPLRGPQGLTGATGAKGDKGDQGEQGLQGAQGIQGIQGPQGIQGIQGLQGDGLKVLGTFTSLAQLPLTGSPGDGYLVNGNLWVWSGGIWEDAGYIEGPAGPTGPAGASAYAVAVAAGYSGDLTSWLASLKGEQGDQGIQGIQGIQGETGAQGVQGIQGIQGIQGVKGDTGDTGSQGVVGPQGPNGNANNLPLVTSVELQAGDFVNLYNDAGVAKVRLADASLLRKAMGFTLADVAAGATATVYPLGEANMALMNMLPGTTYFLGTVGKIVESPVLSAGVLYQRVGMAVATTQLLTINDLAVELT